MNGLKSFAIVLPLLFFAAGTAAEEQAPSEARERMMKSLTKDLGTPGTIELKTLEIRARIYEPKVIYVLDRARIDVNPKDQPVKLAPRIEEPVVENQL